jgi:enoyl-[acyl-carrier protein] reductase I
VEPLARELQSPIFLPCNVQQAGQLEAVFDAVERHWGKLDFALHSIAFAPKEDLHGRLADCSRDGFLAAMDVSCHSFIRMAHLAEPLMHEGGALFTMSYYGAEKVIEHYNVMGPVKAALESVVRYLAYEFGPKGIRVHAISPGPVKTRAASGIDHFDELMERAAQRAPVKRLVSIEDVGKRRPSSRRITPSSSLEKRSMSTAATTSSDNSKCVRCATRPALMVTIAIVGSAVPLKRYE